MKHYLSSFSKALLVPLAITAWVGCSDDNVPGEDQRPGSNSVPGSEVGIRELKVALPRMTRMAPITEDMNCRVHLRGKGDRVNYVVSTFLTLTDDTLFLESHDPILSELPHQMYHLNGVSFPNPKLTSRAGEAAEDTIYVGARLSIENPDDIHLGSTVTVGSNHVGTGTADDPYMIACGTDFIDRICNPMVHGQTHEGEYFELSGNINLNTYDVTFGKGWEPAGHNGDQSSVPFQGDLNGNDCAIEGLLCFSDTGVGGLFYKLGEKSRIHNIDFSNVNLTGGKEIGAVASTSTDGCRLDSLSVSGYIEGLENIGGFVGHGEAAFTACVSEATILGTDKGEGLGGFIGQSTRVSFTDCIRTGKIEAPSSNMVGGYVGGCDYYLDDGSPYHATFERCYTAGSIEAYCSIGGFVGYVTASFTDCHAAATLPLDSHIYSRKWDIFGANEAMVPYALEVKGNEEVGGFAGNAHVRLQGINDFVYKSPSKPSIVADDGSAGAILGNGYLEAQNATVTSYAYVKGGGLYVGGLFGFLSFTKTLSGGVFTNYGNVEGENEVGGIAGEMELTDFGGAVFENSGSIFGVSQVGGIAGKGHHIRNLCMKNFGSVNATEDCVGGYVGYCFNLDLTDGSCMSSPEGSVKVEGGSKVGGIIGYLDCIDSDDMLGHFGSVSANVISKEGTVGGLVGYVNVDFDEDEPNAIVNSESIGDSRAQVTVTSNSGNYAGGGIGYLYVSASSRDSKLCIVHGLDDNLQGSVTSVGDAVGGIIGYAETVNVNLGIYACHNFVTVKGNSPGWGKGYGGILGMQSDTFDYLYFENCSNHAEISGVMLTDVAGIVGYSVHNLLVDECYNAGKIVGLSGAGGLVGYLNDNGEIRKCFNMGEVTWSSDCSYVAGIIGQKEDKSDRPLTLDCVYNIGQTGWGIIGGESGADLDVRNVYYLNTASNGDMEDSGSCSVTADYLRGELPGFDPGEWYFHPSKSAPTLKHTNMYDLIPLAK